MPADRHDPAAEFAVLFVCTGNICRSPAAMPGIVEQLGDDVGVFFDAGPAPSGPASTIVDLSGERPRLLREGAIPAAEIERILEEPFDDAG